MTHGNTCTDPISKIVGREADTAASPGALWSYTRRGEAHQAVGAVGRSLGARGPGRAIQAVWNNPPLAGFPRRGSFHGTYRYATRSAGTEARAGLPADSRPVWLISR